MDALTKELLDFVRRVAMSNTVYKPFAIELLAEFNLPVVADKVTNCTE